MMIEWWTRKREMRDKDESNMEEIGRYENSGVQLT